MFSVALETPLADTTAQRAVRPDAALPLSAFSLIAGVVIADALEKAGLASGPIQLKWPNDLVVAGNKIGGILVEVRQSANIQRLVVGMGINLRAPDLGKGANVASPTLLAGGLLDDGAPDLPSHRIETLLAELARSLVIARATFSAQGFGAFRQQWLARDLYAGRQVSLTDADAELVRGIGAGVDATGSLLVDDGHGPRAFAIGDLSARPVADSGASRTP